MLGFIIQELLVDHMAREYHHNSYGQKYMVLTTNVPPSVGSWRSPIEVRYVHRTSPINGWPRLNNQAILR
jgi:hypothetical protein